MKKSPHPGKNRSKDPFIIFYASGLRFDEEKLPESFPEENKPAVFMILSSALDEREKQAIVSYYGLDGQPRKTILQIASELTAPVSRARIDQIIEGGLRRLWCYWFQFSALLYPRTYYLSQIRQAKERLHEAEHDLCQDPRTAELMMHIAKSVELLKELDVSDAGKKIGIEVKAIEDCHRKMAALTRPTDRENPNMGTNASLNLLDDARKYVEQFSKFSKGVEDGKIVLMEYNESLHASMETKVSIEDSIDSLGLSTYARKRLAYRGIKTISELSMTTQAELLNIRDLGKRTLEEIVYKCSQNGILLAKK